MLRKPALIALAALLTMALSGCNSLLNDNWGRSYETARFNQILNPEADQNLAPVEGLTGPAAIRVMESATQRGAQKQQSSPGLGVLTIQK
jgi:hypothetical protein